MVRYWSTAPDSLTIQTADGQPCSQARPILPQNVGQGGLSRDYPGQDCGSPRADRALAKAVTSVLIVAGSSIIPSTCRRCSQAATRAA